MSNPSTTNRLLLVEDDERIRCELLDAIQGQGWDFRVAINLAGARAALAEGFNLILLDLGLPDGSGLTLLSECRDANRSVPIIVLTARDAPEDRVRGLELGADDYVVKPFHMPELIARIRSVLRRSGRTLGDAMIRLGSLWADPVQRVAGRYEDSFELRRREFDLLLFLMQNPGRPWSRSQLLDRVWGQAFDGDERTVDIHVRRLRALIEEDPSSPTLLLTEWGVGYRMQEMS